MPLVQSLQGEAVVSRASSNGRAFASGRNSDSSTVLAAAVTLPRAQATRGYTKLGHPSAQGPAIAQTLEL
jgi:hypothetical protein